MQILEILGSVAVGLVSPLVHVPLLLLFCWMLSKYWRANYFSKFLSYLSLLWLMFCSMTYTSLLLVYPLEHKYPSVEANSDVWKHADAIVVLACYYFDDVQLPFVSRWPDCSLKRNLQASLMYQARPGPIYLAGGKVAGVQRTLAEYNGEFMQTMGIPLQDLVIITKGHNTQSEVLALSELEGKTIALVTSATHMIRAVHNFEKLGIHVIPVPVEHLSKQNIKFTLGVPNGRSLYRSERAIYEYLGLLELYLFS